MQWQQCWGKEFSATQIGSATARAFVARNCALNGSVQQPSLSHGPSARKGSSFANSCDLFCPSTHAWHILLFTCYRIMQIIFFVPTLQTSEAVAASLWHALFAHWLTGAIRCCQLFPCQAPWLLALEGYEFSAEDASQPVQLLPHADFDCKCAVMQGLCAGCRCIFLLHLAVCECTVFARSNQATWFASQPYSGVIMDDTPKGHMVSKGQDNGFPYIKHIESFSCFWQRQCIPRHISIPPISLYNCLYPGDVHDSELCIFRVASTGFAAPFCTVAEESLQHKLGQRAVRAVCCAQSVVHAWLLSKLAATQMLCRRTEMPVARSHDCICAGCIGQRRRVLDL